MRDVDFAASRIDHAAVGASRVLKQYQESKKFLAYLIAILGRSNEIEDVLWQLWQLPSINIMTGVNLDVIGRIVGAGRQIVGVVNLTYFGFDGFFYETVFGEETDISIGARFYEEGEQFQTVSTLSDADYRLLIRSKIIKNRTIGTRDDASLSLQFLFDTPNAFVNDNFDMTMTVMIGRKLTATELTILNNLDIVPRPAGVGIANIIQYTPPVTPARPNRPKRQL